MWNQGSVRDVSTGAFADQIINTPTMALGNISERNAQWFECNAATAMMVMILFKVR